MDTCLCVNPALETSPTPGAQNTAKHPSDSGSKSQRIRLKWLQGLQFWRCSLIDLQVTTASKHHPQGRGEAHGQAKLGLGWGCQTPASQGCRSDASESIGSEGSAHPSPSAETGWERQEGI